MLRTIVPRRDRSSAPHHRRMAIGTIAGLTGLLSTVLVVSPAAAADAALAVQKVVDARCASVLVTEPLPATGGSGWVIPLAAALTLLAVGLLLTFRGSRPARRPWSKRRGEDV